MGLVLYLEKRPGAERVMGPLDMDRRCGDDYGWMHCKENLLFLIYKEIPGGAVAKSYMRKGFLIYEEMRKYYR
jgi:hypothetical protein